MFDLLKKHKKNSMYRKLFEYLIMFAGLLLIYIILAMALFGQFKNVGKDYVKNLDMQLSIMRKEINGYFGKMAISAMDLSKTSTAKLEEVMDSENISFENLKDNQKVLAKVQDSIFEDLKNSMFNADASGAFVLWDTTVNSKVDLKGDFKSGLYMKLDTRSIKESSIIVYRGDVDVARKHKSMPHRKWKLEYDISQIPNYLHLYKEELPLYDSYNITPVFTLPGTDQRVILITLPIIGKDGKFYGICGFEVEQRYFKEKLSQPSKLDRLTTMFVPVANKEGKIDPSLTLSSGTDSGYYYLPKSTLTMRKQGSSLIEFRGKDSTYLGLRREIPLLKNGTRSMLLVMVPEEDYNRDLFTNIINIVTTVLLFLFFSIGGGLIFTKRYITPIMDGLAKIENHDDVFDDGEDPYDEKFGFYEINELIKNLRKKVKSNNYDGVPAYLAKKFKDFIEATENLTPAEMNVLSLLIQGHNIDELPGLLFVSKSTAKHHILQIYKKLNVSSRGELLLYLDMIKGCGMIDNIIGRNGQENRNRQDN